MRNDSSIYDIVIQIGNCVRTACIVSRWFASQISRVNMRLTLGSSYKSARSSTDPIFYSSSLLPTSNSPQTTTTPASSVNRQRQQPTTKQDGTVRFQSSSDVRYLWFINVIMCVVEWIDTDTLEIYPPLEKRAERARENENRGFHHHPTKKKNHHSKSLNTNTKITTRRTLSSSRQPPRSSTNCLLLDM